MYGSEEEWANLRQTESSSSQLLHSIHTSNILQMNDTIVACDVLRRKVKSPLRGKLRPSSAPCTHQFKYSNGTSTSRTSNEQTSSTIDMIKVSPANATLNSNTKHLSGSYSTVNCMKQIQIRQYLKEYSNQIKKKQMYLADSIQQDTQNFRTQLSNILNEANYISHTLQLYDKYVVITKASLVVKHLAQNTVEDDGCIEQGRFVIQVRHKQHNGILRILSMNRFMTEMKDLRRQMTKRTSNLPINSNSLISSQVLERRENEEESLSMALGYIDTMVTEMFTTNIENDKDMNCSYMRGEGMEKYSEIKEKKNSKTVVSRMQREKNLIDLLHAISSRQEELDAQRELLKSRGWNISYG